jgi:hypothetical protein
MNIFKTVPRVTENRRFAKLLIDDTTAELTIGTALNSVNGLIGFWGSALRLFV